MVFIGVFLIIWGLVFGRGMYDHFFKWPVWLKEYRQVWQETADKLGLTAELSGSWGEWGLRGVVSGHPLRVFQKCASEYGIFTRLELGFPPRLHGLLQFEWSAFETMKEMLAPDVQLGIPELDLNFRIHSTAPTLLQALFTDALVSSEFLKWAEPNASIFEPHKFVRLGISRIVRQPNVRPRQHTDRYENLEDTIHETIAIVDLFCDALDRFAETLASRTGLTRGAEVVRHLPRFEGTRDGVQIGMCEASEGDGLLLTATLSTPVDPTLTIVAKNAETAPATTDRVPMRDPILDAHVHVSTEHPEATRALLTQDQTREDLLALMMAHPNAQLKDGTVSLLVPTVDPDTVAAALDDVVALAVSLSADRSARMARVVRAAATRG